MIEAVYAGEIEKNDDKWAAIVRELAAKYPKDKWAHMLLAGVYRTQKPGPDLEKAIEEYNIALSLDPSFVEPLNQLGYYLYGAEGVHQSARVFPAAKGPSGRIASTPSTPWPMAISGRGRSPRPRPPGSK